MRETAYRHRRDVEVVQHVGEPHLGERARLSIPLATPLRPRALHRYQRVDQDLAEEALAPTRVEHLADVAEQRDALILVVETGRQRDGGHTSLSAPLMTASVGDADQRSPVCPLRGHAAQAAAGALFNAAPRDQALSALWISPSSALIAGSTSLKRRSRRVRRVMGMTIERSSPVSGKDLDPITTSDNGA